MAIVINANDGSISGLSVGGLPDGTVDAGTVAADVATQAEIDAKLALAGGTMSGALNITLADNTDTLTLTSTDADAAVGPVLRLNRDSGSPAASDLLGSIIFQADDDGGNSINFVEIITQMEDATAGSRSADLFLKTRTNGSLVSRIGMYDSTTVINDDGADIDFRVESDNLAHALFVQGSNGNVGIGTNNPASNLEIQTTGGGSLATILIDGGTDGGSDGGSRLHMKYGGSQYWAIQHRNQTSIGSAHALVIGDADFDNGVYINQNSNSWSGVSDERLKTSISQIENAVDKLNTLQAVNFKWKYGSEERKIQNNLGLLAQEVYEVFPEAVDYHEIEDFELIDHPTIEGTKQAKDALGISPTILIAPLVKAIQELSAKNEELTTRIEALENP